MKRRVKNASKEERSGARVASLSVEGELALASMNPYLPLVDLHGLPRDAVTYELDRALYKNPQTSIRVVYGHGKGILKEEVFRFLRERMERKESDVLGFAPEMSGGSCVVRVK